jgi:hypothetical protein
MKINRRVRVFSVLVLLALALPAYTQGRRTRGTQPARSAPSVDVPPATFIGLVQIVDKGSLTLQEEDSNTLRFVCSRKTHYFDGEKKIKLADIKTGDHVRVETKRFPDGELEAINIWIEHPKTPKPADPKPS